jgi:hypothetical protein
VESEIAAAVPAFVSSAATGPTASTALSCTRSCVSPSVRKNIRRICHHVHDSSQPGARLAEITAEPMSRWNIAVAVFVVVTIAQVDARAPSATTAKVKSMRTKRLILDPIINHWAGSSAEGSY